MQIAVGSMAAVAGPFFECIRMSNMKAGLGDDMCIYSVSELFVEINCSLPPLHLPFPTSV